MSKKRYIVVDEDHLNYKVVVSGDREKRKYVLSYSNAEEWTDLVKGKRAVKIVDDSWSGEVSIHFLLQDKEVELSLCDFWLLLPLLEVYKEINDNEVDYSTIRVK